jgi:hypothetical protein
VTADRIQLLDASLGEASRVISHWGTGLGQLAGRTDSSRADV